MITASRILFTRILAAIVLQVLIVQTLSATTIEWQASSAKFVTSGVYARVKKLSTGVLALVYSSGSAVYVRRSSDIGATWGSAIRVAQAVGYSYTNAELIELENGWLVYGWNGRPTDTGAYFIASIISRDMGLTWADERRIYYAGRIFGEGCWEPAFLQLPGGSLQVYFANEKPYVDPNSDQEIGMIQSADNGLTWGNYTKVSYRAGSRDGMPVPVLLQGDSTIAVAIEDNGLSGYFKPAIVTTPVSDNWTSGFVSGTSNRRSAALTGSAALPASVYAGAPYLVRLPSGETALSVQSTEGRTLGDPAHIYSIMRVYVGDRQAKNFGNNSIPFTGIPANGSGLWNSLNVINDSTIMAVSSISGLSQNGIWTAIGKIRYSVSTVRQSGLGQKPARLTADRAIRRLPRSVYLIKGLRGGAVMDIAGRKQAEQPAIKR